jgi:hypothetical protein
MLYKHKTLELKYTTYDMREERQTLYQRLFPDIMVFSDHDEARPYLYGRVIDFFQVRVTNNGPNSLLPHNQEAELPMAWIRWFKPDESQGPSGFHALRYPSVSFHESSSPDAFGFVHPDEIIRSVHLIPHFKFDKTKEYLSGPSKGRPGTHEQDWKRFNVNM